MIKCADTDYAKTYLPLTEDFLIQTYRIPNTGIKLSISHCEPEAQKTDLIYALPWNNFHFGCIFTEARPAVK
jgi:hypothetical protein